MLCAIRAACGRGSARPAMGSSAGLFHRSFSRTSIGMHASVPKLTLYTGTDCQLCDVVKMELDRMVKEDKDFPKFDLTLYNIRDDSLKDVHQWRRAYQYDIPVLHLNGHEIARHRIDRKAVAEQIRQAASAT